MGEREESHAVHLGGEDRKDWYSREMTGQVEGPGGKENWIWFSRPEEAREAAACQNSVNLSEALEQLKACHMLGVGGMRTMKMEISMAPARGVQPSPAHEVDPCCARSCPCSHIYGHMRILPSLSSFKNALGQVSC